jgi:membrane protease subunit (stomatin/prohibitin family)
MKNNCFLPYSKYYNNSFNSDFTIKVEGSSNKYYAHKIVLSAHSEVFEEITKNNDEYTFETVNENLVQVFLQYIYKGEIDEGDKKTVIQFLILSQKVTFYIKKKSTN